MKIALPTGTLLMPELSVRKTMPRNIVRDTPKAFSPVSNLDATQNCMHQIAS